MILYGAKSEDWDYKQDKTAVLSYFISTLEYRVVHISIMYKAIFNKQGKKYFNLLLKFKNCDCNKKKSEFFTYKKCIVLTKALLHYSRREWNGLHVSKLLHELNHRPFYPDAFFGGISQLAIKTNLNSRRSPPYDHFCILSPGLLMRPLEKGRPCKLKAMPKQRKTRRKSLSVLCFQNSWSASFGKP